MSGSRIYVVGSANMDLVMDVAALPRLSQTVAGGDLRFIPGGKGANQACAAARTGGLVSMVAQVGPDPFGRVLRQSLSAAGVATDLVGTSERPSGCASIYVLPDGENCIVVSPGANASLDPRTALERLAGLRAGDFILLQLEIPLETVAAVAGHARAAGAITMLDPAPARALPPELLRQIDYLTPNQTEACILAGRPEAAIDNLEQAAEIARELEASGSRNIILKLGELGCMVGGRHISGRRVRAVDTTAAGDVFNGALATALAEGCELASAAEWANAAAAISVTRHGAQTSIPTREEVESLCSVSRA
jgi:ribokinase